MRKLSKKISMLMVLAMLVSLFSGIVSASAASAWSFASSKYDVDVKETIVMDKNEYADFDLYKEGKEVTKATYTVKWASSDEDVVWVNAKTGQLRADKFGVAEAGDKAKISATFTNVKTQKSATRYFYIEIADAAKYAIVADIADEAYVAGEKYALAAKVTADGKEVAADVAFTVDGAAATEFTPAKAGEYTIIATATIDGKAVATEKFVATVVEAGLEAAKQVSYNTVALTFGGADAAKAVAADASKIAVVWLAGSNEINAFVKGAKVDEKNAAVVNVELYNNIAKDTTYKFTVAEKSAEIVGVDLTKYARIEIATTSVPACDNETKIKVNFYNAAGVLVDVKNEGFTLNADASGDYYINGTNIYFYDQYSPKTATVTATYFMGYDENGNRIDDLKATATITSYNAAATNAGNINGWAVDGCNKAGEGLTYGGNTANLAVNDAVQLYFKYDVTNIYGVPTTHYSSNQTSYFGGFEYSTTNEAVLLVDSANGYLYPVAAGSAQVVVKSIASYDANVKNVIGVFTVNVVASKNLTSIAPVVSKTKLSANTGDIVWIKPEAKDQFGAGFTPDVYKIELVYADADVAVEIKTGDDSWAPLRNDAVDKGDPYATTGSDNGVPYFEIKATSAKDWAKNVQIAITATQWNPYKEITRVVSVSVKNAGNPATYSIDNLAANVDLNFAGKPSWASGSWYFEKAFALNAYDNAGYFVGNVTLNKGLPENVANGDFYFEIYKGSEKLTNTTNDPTVWNIYANGGPTWEFRAMKADTQTVDGVDVSDFKNLAKGAGTYTITVYQYNETTSAGRQITQKSIVVTDSSAPITVIQKDNKINLSAIAVSGTVVEAKLNDVLESKLTFKRDGKDVAFEIADIDYTVTADGKRIYVTNVTVRQVLDNTFNITWSGSELVNYDRKIYGVGKVFEIDITK